MPFLTPTDCQRRLIQLSREWGVDLPIVPAPLTRPHNPPSFWTAKDDQTAEELLQRRASEAAQYQKKSSLSKAFSSNNLKKGKNWDPPEILEVLASWIASKGTPGVVEALISKLSAAGVEFSGNHIKQKNGILNRRKSLDTFIDRAKFLKLAVQGNQYDILQVLLPHADPYSVDQALGPAIRTGNIQIAELLLRYGACASQSPEGQDAFRQACIKQNRSNLIGLLLQAEHQPSPAWTSACMTDAASAACLETVIHLSRSTADGCTNRAEALKAAIVLGRQDIALAIIMGNKPPQGPGLAEAFQVLFDLTTISASTKTVMAELLLCAGARGDIVSRALERAVEAQFYDMASLLAKYGASAEFNDASALKTAISRGEVDFVTSFLTESAKLTPALASSCVPLIAKHAAPGTRATVLSLLLRKGAKGVALDNMLIDAAAAGDIASVELLLSPNFPPSASTTAKSNPSPRHEVASVDHKSGEALRIAVLRGDAIMADKILSNRPTAETLSRVFPMTKKLTPKNRYQMVQLFLKRSLPGSCLHGALHDAINEDASQRDIALVQLLLENNADINFSQGPGLTAVIQQRDTALLQSLLEKASPQTAAARVTDAMNILDHRERFNIMAMLINAGAVMGTKQIASALLQTLGENPVDMSLLKLLLQQGGADVNLFEGAIAQKAVSNSDPKVLDLVFGLGRPSPSTVTYACNELAPQPSNDNKAWKLRAVLSKCTHKEDLNRLLVHEVQLLVKSGNDQVSLSTLKILLDGGADPNAYKSAAFCHAIKGSNATVTDMLFNAKIPLTATSIGAALPHVLQVSDSMARLSLMQRLMQMGAHPLEANRALIHALTAHPKDVALQSVLAAAADTSDGEAMTLCVSKESPETLDLLLVKSRCTRATRNAMLGKVMEVGIPKARYHMCESLLKLGISSDVASAALLVATRDGDVQLGDLLMAHGASISSNNGQVVVEACRSGSAELLGILLKQNESVNNSILEAGFQAATEIRDLNKKALVYDRLLKKGLKGDLVDAQLQPAAQYGEDGQAVLRTLLAAGADPNFNNGECVVAAIKGAFIGNLEVLLGLWTEGGAQRKVAQPALTRALKACWTLNRESRFQVLNDLFKAGLQANENLHIALNEAVNEDDPEDRIVRLLLEHGASPAANGCKTLVDAVNRSASGSLTLLLETNLPQEVISRAFNNAFVADTFNQWFSESGLETARLLLKHGATADSLSGALVLAIKHSKPETEVLTDQFVTLLVGHGADVNFDNGEPLQQAASKANPSWTKQLLGCRPTVEALSLAFQCIFDTVRSQNEVLDLIKMFSEYRDGEVRVDVMDCPPDSQPILVRALSQYPRSKKILETLLDAGLYHDQATAYRMYQDIEDAEEMTLLLWAIAQPQKRVSNAVIELLVSRGANVNAQTSITRTTPLMLAIQTRRPDLVKLLLVGGAEVDVLNYYGRTPLATATQIGGDISAQMISLLLAADPSRDDGSLHNAARDLNLLVVKVLVQAGHDPDFPSPLHEGRSALAEICLRGSDDTEMTPDRERAMQKVMAYLIDQKSDLTVKSEGKSLLQLCFESTDAITTTKCFLKSGMWKYVNKSFNNYTVDGYTYSPTMYIRKLLPISELSDSLLGILRSNRAHDVYYTISGAQPQDAVGLPEDMEIEERARQARMSRLAEENEDFSITMARKRELASVEQQILRQKGEMEDMRRQKLHSEDIAAVTSRAQLEESLASTAHTRRLQEHQTLAESSVGRSRALAATELEAEEAKHRKVLEWETKINTERVDNARALSSIRINERQEVEKLERGAESRIKEQLEAQRKLIESQEKLAKSLAEGPSIGLGLNDPRRQIGYVTELS